MNSYEKGKLGENLAADILNKEGYSILERNYRVGRYGEVDIIAYKDKTYCFIEVKARQNLKYGLPIEAVVYGKMKKILNVSSAYMIRHKITHHKSRIDILEIMYKVQKNKAIVENYTITENCFI